MMFAIYICYLCVLLAPTFSSHTDFAAEHHIHYILLAAMFFRVPFFKNALEELKYIHYN
jgi:hypothetical protein